MADDPALPGSGGRSGNKKALAPHGTKTCCLCDTTQIDAIGVHSLTRTIIRAPMDNGWDTRRNLLGRPFSPPSGVHSPAAPRPDLTIRDSLKVCRTGYYSFSQVSCCLVVGVIIAAPPPVCQASIFPDADLFSTAPAPDRKPAARKKGFGRRAKAQFNSEKGKLPYTSNIRSP